MQTLDLTTVIPRIQSVLALGMEGSGKTHFVGTFPKPILLFSFDSGYQTLAGVEGIRAKVFLEPDRKRPKAAAEFEKEFLSVLEGKEPPFKWPDGREEPFKTVALDPLSFYSLYMMHQIQYVNRTMERKPSWDEYDIILKKGTDLLIKCLQITTTLDAQLVATCHLMTDKDEDTGQLWFLPDMLGSLRNKLGAWFDMVVYLKCEKKPGGQKEYQLCTVGERRERARLRLPSALDGLIKAVDVPDFSVIQQRIVAKYQVQPPGGST